MQSALYVYSVLTLHSANIVSFFSYFYSKVRLDPKTMEIVANDTRFSTFERGPRNRYGRQTKHHLASPSTLCKGSSGYFSLDLSGTGLNPDQSWFKSQCISLVIKTKKGSKYFVHWQGRNCEVCGPKRNLIVSINRCLRT